MRECSEILSQRFLVACRPGGELQLLRRQIDCRQAKCGGDHCKLCNRRRSKISRKLFGGSWRLLGAATHTAHTHSAGRARTSRWISSTRAVSSAAGSKPSAATVCVLRQETRSRHALIERDSGRVMRARRQPQWEMGDDDETMPL